MANGGADSPAPPSENGGEFLLSLLHRRPLTRQSPSQGPEHHQHQSFPPDPAVAAVGPTMNGLPPSSNWPSTNDGRDRDRLGAHNLPPWPLSFSPPNRSPNLLGLPQFPPNSHPLNQFINGNTRSLEDAHRLGLIGTGNHAIQPPPQQQSEKPKLLFGSFSGDPSQSLVNGNSNHRNPQSVVSNSNPDLNLLSHQRNPQSVVANSNPDLKLLSYQWNHEQRGGFSGGGNYGPIGNNNGRGLTKSTPPPLGFSSDQREWERELAKLKRNQEWDINVNLIAENVERFTRLATQNQNRLKLGQQINHPGPSMGTTSQHSVPGDDVGVDPEETYYLVNDPEDTYWLLNKEARGEGGEELRQSSKGKKEINGEFDDILDKIGQDIAESLLLDDQTELKDPNDDKKSNRTSREKESRNDNRGQNLLWQRERNVKKYMTCRNDIRRFDEPFMMIYMSLIPAEEELEKQRQLMAKLENLVTKEWPQAKLYLYGSCANSFGFPKSDIDVCLAIEDDEVNKAEMLLKLADILESDNFQNVQALTRARVPIVKLMDPVTGISCDICINNVLAVVNTKLLRDYSRIDGRLRQLAFIVKHWAKSRRVNETYQGTLSSYAYVLMCIFFLQQRRPPILPCLQEMDPTYSVRVDNIRCEYFDNVERLSNFGSKNRETISELVWGFFSYWAYAHDYANNVISVRTASILGKREKDWTRRVGNDRHLICIEDPFETSHDLGRVVDKFSIRVLREEFERAAKIMQQDPLPFAKLFEIYLPPGDNYYYNGHHHQQGHN